MATTIFDLLRGVTSTAKSAATKGVATLNTVLKKGAELKKQEELKNAVPPSEAYKLSPMYIGDKKPEPPVAAILRAPTQKESNKISYEALKANPTVAGGFNLLNSLNTQLGSAIQNKVVNPAPVTKQQVQQNLSLSSLPARIASELFPGAARATEAVTRPVLSSAEKAYNYANASDEYKTKNTLEGVAALGNLGYEAAMLYGGLAKGAPAVLGSLAQPRLVSGLASAAPQDVQGFVRPALEAYSILKSPDKVLAGLNVAAGRATDPLSNYVNNSQLSQPVKDIANLGINLGENFLAYKGAKAFAPSQAGFQAGYKAYQEGKPFGDVAEIALDARDAALRASKPQVTGPKVGEVLGYQSPEQKGIPEGKVKKIVPQEFRADKLGLDEEGTTKMKQLQDDLKLTTRQVRSFEEMADLAKQFDADPDKLLSSNKRITDAEVIALKNLIAQDSDFIAKNEGREFTNSKDAEINRMKIDEADARIQKAVKRLIPAGTEAGRAVVAFKLLANKNMSPEAWYIRAQKVKGTKDLTPEERTNIRKLVEENDRTGLALYTANLRQAGLPEKIATVWKAGLLSAPVTHEVNIIGNAAQAAVNVPERLIATGLDKVASLVTGKRSVSYSPLASLKGYGKGVANAYEYAKTGIDADALNRVDLKVNPIKNPILHGYTEAVFRSLGAADAFFKGGPYAESLASQAKVIAMNEGLTGKAFKDRFKYLLAKPTDDMVLTAKKEAQVATFQQDNIVADSFSNLKNKLYKSDSPYLQTAGLALDIVSPFAKTPVNVAVAIGQRTPLGLLTTLAKQVSPSTRSQKELVEGLSKSITGTGLIGLGAMLFNAGLVTGLPPDDPKERERWYAEGKQANSVRVGDEWFSINRVAPIGALLSLGAEFARQGGDKKGIDRVVATGFTGLKNLTDQTFLRGVGDILKAVQEPEIYGEKWAGNLVSSIVPSLVGRIARGLDPTLRKPDSIGDFLKAKTPGLTQDVAPVVDLFGNEVTREGGLVKSLFDPFNSKSVNKDPVLQEVQKVGADIGVPSNRMYNTALDTREFAEYQKLQGGVLRDTLEAVMDSDMYRKANEIEKAELVEEAAQEVHSAVKEVAFPAIMIHRYGLPADTDPTALTEILNETNKVPEFKQMPLEEQKLVILDVLSALQ